MLKFVQSIFKFKITWKLRLKIFYFFAKIHALAHFTYVEKRKKVCFSLVSAVYGSVWVVGYMLLLILILSSIDEFVDDDEESVTLLFVNELELITIALKGFFIYFLQVVQSRDLVLLLNDAIEINQVINYKNTSDKIDLYGHRFMSFYTFKRNCFLLQILVFFVSFYIYVEQTSHHTIDIIFGFLICYTHVSTVIVCGLYFYGSILFGYEFYHSLNSKLILILKQVELHTKSGTQMESSCHVSDELDKISILYTRITAYVTSINRIFSVQITFELLGSFFMITCALFYMFYALTNSQELGSEKSSVWDEPLFEILNSAMYCLVYFIEIYTITYISNAITDEAEKLSSHIHKVVFIKPDKRFIRSVQHLSLQTLFEKPEISPMGMFIIDRSLIIGIGATIATYVIILIQFQLDRKPHSVGIL